MQQNRGREFRLSSVLERIDTRNSTRSLFLHGFLVRLLKNEGVRRRTSYFSDSLKWHECARVTIGGVTLWLMFTTLYQSTVHPMQAQQQPQMSSGATPGTIGGLDPSRDEYEQRLKSSASADTPQPPSGPHLTSNPLGPQPVSICLSCYSHSSLVLLSPMLRGIGVPSLCPPRHSRVDSASNAILTLLNLSCLVR